MNRMILVTTVCLSFALASCKQESGTAPADSAKTAAPEPAPKADAPAAQKPEAAAGHGGKIIELGTEKSGDLTVRASRDEGEIKPGGDAPIDVWLTTADGQPATVSAVRFWIGTEDAKGSVKAKADIEDPAQPNHWHTHAEVPDPLPDGSRLWVEIEQAGGAISAASFDLAR